MSESPGTLLRVKRRRTDESFSALYVQQSGVKRFKSDEDAVEEAQVFQFVGRVVDPDSLDIKNILQKTRDSCSDAYDTPEKVQSPVSDKTTKKFQDHLKRKRQHTPSSNTFRVMQYKKSKTDTNDKYAVKTPDEKTFLDSHDVNVNAVVEKEETQGLFKIFDVFGDESNKEHSHCMSNEKTHIVFDEDLITCNAVTMLREKLTLVEQGEKKPEYTYDFYFAPCVDLVSTDQKLYIEPLDERIFYDEHCDNETEEVFDDEDDSNDESNWRNDYPDEDWDKTSQDENDRSSDSSEDFVSPYSGYRTRNTCPVFNPYYEENDEYDFEIYDEN